MKPTDNELKLIAAAGSFSQLSKIAIAMIEKQIRLTGRYLGEVCGPISTGGLGDREKNLEVFNLTIRKLEREGVALFDQIPFEDKIKELAEKILAGRKTYCFEILEQFYLPIFETHLINSFYFIHGWEDSIGAEWERSQAKRLKITIVDLEEDFHVRNGDIK